MNRDRYPVFRPGFRVLQYTDKVVDVPGDAVAPWRLVKEVHIFSLCCSRCLLGILTLFPRAPCIWQQLAQTPITLRFTLGNWELFLRAVSGSHRVRQSTLLLEEFHIFIVLVVPASLRSSHLKNLDIISTCSLWRWEGFSAALTHFSRSSRSSGVERHFSEPSMVKSSLPSRAPAQFILSVCWHRHSA